MREIKFRAWNNAVQMMVAPDAFNALVEGKKVAGQHPPVVEKYEVESEVQTGSFDGLIEKNIPVYSTITETLQREIVQPVEFMQGNPFVANELTVMQYTGLKDKNGVEIYEGDTLLYLPRKLFVDSEQSRRYGKVYWKEKDACFGLLTFRIDDRVANYDEPFPMTGIEKHEVIGNIWENPELLEVGE